MSSVVTFHSASREFTPAEVRGSVPLAELSVEDLRHRVEQQALLSEFGVLALRKLALSDLQTQAARIAAEGVKAEFAKVLKFFPQEERFLVCAGVGWGPGVVGVATVGADMASPAGYALKTGKPVISNHLGNEERFRTPELLVKHGIRRAMNVILEGDGTPYGVLEVDSRSEAEFNEDDLVFLQGIANILGMAIERERSETNIQQAMGRQEILLKEINHRVNNSLQIVSGMLHLQSSNSKNDEVRHELGAASNRIGAIARAHQRLYSSNQIHELDLSAYLREVCRDLEKAIPGCEIIFSAEDNIEIATDRAIPAALLVNELVTNIAKYACKPGECRAWLSLARGAGEIVTISVRDEGFGLPPDFDLKSKRRLGMQLINAFVTQLRGDLAIRRLDPGTEFTLTIPLIPA